MYEQDYIMRLIKEAIKFIAKVFLNVKDNVKDKDELYYDLLFENENSQTDYLHNELLKLIQLGKINEAENLLYEKLDTSNKRHIGLALDFYNRLNDLNDDFLEKNNFSREEIAGGIKDIAKEFGMQGEFLFLSKF